MAEPMTVRFSIGEGRRPTPEQVAHALRDKAAGVRLERGAYEVDFDAAEGEEADALWLMICEIGAVFPGAVIEE